MFNFLKRKVSLADSGILKGMTDYHSHLLPGVDDGVKTMAETLEILEERRSKASVKCGLPRTLWKTSPTRPPT